MVHIRRASASDAQFIAETYRPIVEDNWASFEESAPDRAEMIARIDAAGDLYPWLIAESDERLAYAYASPHRSRAAYASSVDTTIYCAPSARGEGVGKVLYGALLQTVALQNYVMAFGGIALPNEASVALHKSAGFELIGTYPNVGYKAGAWRSVQWWGKPLSPPTDLPQPILNVSDVFTPH